MYFAVDEAKTEECNFFGLSKIQFFLFVLAVRNFFLKRKYQKYGLML